MATVLYYVRTSLEKKNPTINIRVKLKISTITYYGITPYLVEFNSWNKKKQRIDQEKFKDTELKVNSNLLKLEAHILNAFNKVTNKEIIDSNWVQTQIDEYSDPQDSEEKKELRLLDFIDDFVLNAPNMTIKKSGKKLDPKTITKYKLTQKYINEVAKTFNPKILLKNVDYNFYEEYYDFLTINKGFAVNNVGKHIDTLKVFLHAAERRGHSIHRDIEFFIEPSEDSENIYFREDELEKLYRKDLSKSPYLERVRDLFIIGCWTGLRYSDLSTLERDDLIHDKIRVTNRKTGNKVILPLHQHTKMILEKYNYKLPNKIAISNFNDYIKEACQIAVLDEPFKKTMTKGGEKKTTTSPKWSLTSSHTARRSFATNLYKKGVPSITIMALTGHKTEKAFLAYIKVTPEEHAEILQKVFDDDQAKILKELELKENNTGNI
jgi:integrase